ncbi:HugZ family pyridoxamine 5'-phosphate oxidase [Azospirillum sp. sgz301742]
MSSTADSSGPKSRGPADSHSVDQADSPGESARRVLRGADRAALATGQRDGAGWPYPSLALTALDHDGTPLLLISRLADHTQNILADSRVGLLFDGTAGLAQPLAGARVSVLGRAVPSDEPRHRDRYLARHPDAALYAGFADFALYRVEVERAHLVAGFGRIHWIGAADLLLPAVPAGLAAGEADLVRHMNEEESDAVQLFAGVLLGLPGDEGWTVTGIDPEGVDLRRGGAIGRLDFEHRVHDGEGAKAELIRLAVRARRQRQDAAGVGHPPPHS